MLIEWIAIDVSERFQSCDVDRLDAQFVTQVYVIIILQQIGDGDAQDAVNGILLDGIARAIGTAVITRNRCIVDGRQLDFHIGR